jgi:hypothetical protein
MIHDHLMPILLMIGPPISVITQLPAYESELARLARYGYQCQLWAGLGSPAAHATSCPS